MPRRRTDMAHDRFATVQADTDFDRRFSCETRTGVEFLHVTQYLARCGECGSARLLQRLGSAEHRYDSVSQERYHGPTAGMDQVNDLSKIAIEKADHIFRTHAFAARGVSSNVGKHYAYE